MPLANFLKETLDMSPLMPMPNSVKADAKELIASEMIPYTVHYDDQTVITKDNGLIQVIKLEGLYFESLTEEQIKLFERRRNTALRAIAHSDRGVYVHLIRRKVNSYPAGEGETWFSRYFNKAWRQRCEQRSFYRNDIYISIVCNRFRQGGPGLLDRAISLVSDLSVQKVTQEDVSAFEEQAKTLYETSNLVLQTLADYKPRRLTIQKSSSTTNSPTIVYSEIARFFYYLINLKDSPCAISELPLDQTLAASRLNFKTVSNFMEVQGLFETKAAAVLSMAEWPAHTSSSMLDEFLKLPVEIIITQSFFFTDRISAEHDMREERRRLSINNEDGTADEDKNEISQGLQDLSRGCTVNGLHHLTILVHVSASSSPPTIAETSSLSFNKNKVLSTLNNAVGLLEKAFVNLGVKAVREWFALETFFWAQLPGQAQHFIARRGKIKSSNFAGFASLHNYAIGKSEGNLWGPALMPFETESGSAYHFNFHREIEGMVAGHTAFCADTGAGKTTLLAALIAMADKAKPRVFWFDNREGAKVFMAAMGGQHITLSTQEHTEWNPFQLPDTSANRTYLIELLTLMRTCYGGVLIPDDVERFKKTVEENYQLPLSDRRLRNLAWCFGQGQLAHDMRVWHGANGYEGANWKVFDNADDHIDFVQCRHYCYEMQQLIKSGTARPELPVILSYPFHRIEQTMNGNPFIIVLEEGQNLVKHAYWKDKIDSLIMQIRRKNGILIFVTPDAKYLYCETDSIQKQTATKIFLPNGEANRADYVDVLGLTEAEFEFIRDTPPEHRKFLIRRGNESIKAIFDLSDIPEFISVLSSNDKSVRLMNEIRQELKTDDPEQWVPIFMQRALKQNTHNLNR